MAAKTIGLDDEAYEQLKAEKREGKSFSDTVKRITSEVACDWRHSAGKYSSDRVDAFETAVRNSRDATSRGLAKRQREANALFAGIEDTEAVDAETGEDGSDG